MGSCEDWRDWNHQIGVCKKDPMSHRIIEKRRRDRMNNCLADLSRLIPAEYLKKGRGRIEKTEIIEMAIKHMKFLQAQTCNNLENYEAKTENDHCLFNDKQYVNGVRPQEPGLSPQDQYKYGYQECLAETMHFLVELEGYIPTDTLCVKLIAHLQKYFEKIAKGDKIVYRAPLENISSSHNYDFKMNGMNTGSITDDVEKNGANCMITTVNSDDNYLNNGDTNSQLREMLVGPHRNTLYVPTIRPKIIRHSSPEPLSPQPELNNSDTHSVNGSYKFKNYIKERFSAEHSNSNSSAENSKSPPFGDLYANKRKTEYSSRITYSPPNLNNIKINDHCPGSRPIPIFALHSKGSFYIPLTIDSHLLTPFLTELNYDHGVTACSSMVLHPVTISVNFNRTTELSKEIECKPILSPNINLTPRIQNGPLLIIPECR